MASPNDQPTLSNASATDSRSQVTYEYVVEESEVLMNQSAYLMVEGVGINGGYAFRNHVTVRGNSLHISSQGWAPSTQAPESGSAVFGMHAELKEGSRTLETAVLDNSGVNAWPVDPRYSPIGHASFQLPKPRPGKSLKLYLQGTFIYQTSSGSVTPMPPSTSTAIPIQVVER